MELASSSEKVRHPTVELTRPRGCANCDLQKHLEKHAIAARVQRFVGHPLEPLNDLGSFPLVFFFRNHVIRAQVLQALKPSRAAAFVTRLRIEPLNIQVRYGNPSSR